MYRLIPHNTKSVSPFETVFRNFFGESGGAPGHAVDVFEPALDVRVDGAALAGAEVIEHGGERSRGAIRGDYEFGGPHRA